MRKLILLFAVITLALTSCKKKEVAPTTPPTIVNTKVEPTFGAYTQGVVGIYLGQPVLVNNAPINLVGSANIDMPNTQVGTYSPTLDIDSLYHVDFKLGNGIKYGADLTFKADGSYTEVNKTGNLQMVKTLQSNGGSVLMFQP